MEKNDIAYTADEYKTGQFKYISCDLVQKIEKEKRLRKKKESVMNLRNGAKIRASVLLLSLLLMIFTKLPMIVSLSPIFLLVLLALLFSVAQGISPIKTILGLFRFAYPDPDESD